MIRTLIQLFTFAFLIVGIIVCAIGYKKNNCFKGGLFFFIFSVLANIVRIMSSYAANIFIQRYIDLIGAKRINFVLQFFDLPGFVLSSTGFIIFIIFLVKGLNENKHNGNYEYSYQSENM